MNRPATLLTLAVLAGAVAVQPGSAQPDAKLAQQAHEILKKNCFKCHGDKGSKKGKIDYILDAKQLVEKKKIKPGDLDKSRLYEVLADEIMPPEEEKVRPSKADIELIAKWIKAGAPAPGGKPEKVAKKEKKETKPDQPDDANPPTGAEAVRLAVEARNVLQKNCYVCHGPGKKVGGVDYILDVATLKKRKKVVAGNLDKSRLFRLVSEKEMPPPTAKVRPGPDEIKILERWIKAGAPDFPDSRRKVVYKSFQDTMEIIYKHQRTKERRDRKYWRYFTFTHLNNNPDVTETDLRTYQAALSKVVNSLSFKKNVFAPEKCDPEGTVLAVDLRKLDWDRCHLWNEMLKSYPYGLTIGEDEEDEKVKDLIKDVYIGAGTKIPAVRGDWFIATASRPPLYHFLLFETLMGLPRNNMTAYDLEQKLGVDVEQNILDDKVWRAGFSKSGVSQHNRLIERHESPYGAYWKSYDFKSSAGFQNLHRYPLGPVFLYKKNPYQRQAFRQDGGEIIFNLPNGLQGYLLIDNKDKRIDEGPIDVVKDNTEAGGKATVVNGISCMSCHKHGMITDFKDTVRAGTGLAGSAKDKVRRIFPKDEVMRNVLEEDSDRFMGALKRAVGPFVMVGADKEKKLEEFVEPVALVGVRHVVNEVTLEMAAYELGLKDPERLKRLIEASERLQSLGLLPLAQGETIKRETWESLGGFLSPFQEVASRLKVGDPIRVR